MLIFDKISPASRGVATPLEPLAKGRAKRKMVKFERHFYNFNWIFKYQITKFLKKSTFSLILAMNAQKSKKDFDKFLKSFNFPSFSSEKWEK